MGTTNEMRYLSTTVLVPREGGGRLRGMRFSRVGIRWRLIYVYDALCPWCFAFTPVVRELASHFGKILDYEVLSGGMLRGDQVRVVGGSEEAERLRERYERIEEIAGIRFGNRFFESIARGERLFDSRSEERRVGKGGRVWDARWR